jgi:hypothetical protein
MHCAYIAEITTPKIVTSVGVTLCRHLCRYLFRAVNMQVGSLQCFVMHYELNQICLALDLLADRRIGFGLLQAAPSKAEIKTTFWTANQSAW